ncbi:LEF-6 [Chrysodeixis includens nucleopolyhedrovirus]|uniref:LEF-6 n=1 Tax=Chrysodeixis includens nucleopolyhedrovirus TaxID=1207438 RepID=A0A1C8ZYJ2_9ABAC|nr:LEF-6 [Chrysodeixis includens nucleopolyhedrovirus]AOL56600.1 LEF-6 [Chrysodeixis includens nucleopolyhedrovirus]AOL56741.1 LEF-6 [Chrysodeixis includens nucleopolyhedrovirus]AOL56883.1 LEF-6 [Chrysodeixis includens nucleopolyhedrovirus]
MYDYTDRDSFVFYVNGENVDKKFIKDFINHVCGGRIKADIEHDKCTRKRIVLTSRYAANKLMAVNRRVYWPDGSLFKCKLKRPYRKTRDIRRCRRRHSYNHIFDNLKQDCSSIAFRSAAVNDDHTKDSKLDDDWYNSATFIDVDLGGDGNFNKTTF